MNSLEKAILFFIILDVLMLAVTSVLGYELLGVIILIGSLLIISISTLIAVIQKYRQLQSETMNFIGKMTFLLIILNVLMLVLVLVSEDDWLWFGVIFFICSSLITTFLALAALRKESQKLQSEDCYESLSPTKEFQQEDIETGSQCAICGKEFKNEEQIQPFGECVHVFHSSCLNSGLLDGKITCPVCSQGLKIDIC